MKKIHFLLLILLYCIFFIGCDMYTPSDNNDEMYYSFKDDLNNNVELSEKPTKVVALMGSYAEIWLLAGGDILGVTEDTVSERNMSLGNHIKIVGSVKEPNLEVILSLLPDFVILSTDIASHVKLDDTLKSANIPHAYLKEDNHLDYLRILKIFTDITQKNELYEKHGITVQNYIDNILSKIPSGADKPEILLIRSMSTKAKALKDDHMTGVILKELNTDNIASRHESMLEDLSMENIISENPDYIFVVTMGDTEKALAVLENGLISNPAWSNLDAVKNGRYHVLPKELFQYKPNARWGESYEYLYKILYL